MQQKTIYICEHCGAEYDTEEECLKCENSHVKTEEILTENFHTEPSRLNYPDVIYVKMKDNKTVAYGKVQGR